MTDPSRNREKDDDKHQVSQLDLVLGKNDEDLEQGHGYAVDLFVGGECLELA